VAPAAPGNAKAGPDGAEQASAALGEAQVPEPPQVPEVQAPEPPQVPEAQVQEAVPPAGLVEAGAPLGPVQAVLRLVALQSAPAQRSPDCP